LFLYIEHINNNTNEHIQQELGTKDDPEKEEDS